MYEVQRFETNRKINYVKLNLLKLNCEIKTATRKNGSIVQHQKL